MRGWKSARLADLCSIEIGRTPPRDNPRYWDPDKTTDNVWVSIADMTGSRNSAILVSKEQLSDEGAAITPIVPEGALLLSFKLSLGKLAFAGKALRTNEAIAALIVEDVHTLDPRFLFWYLRSFDWAAAAKGNEKIKGATLNKAKLKEIPVPIPPLAEQACIVSILDEAFEGITKATSNVERNLTNARELFLADLRATFVQLSEEAPQKKLMDVCSEFGRGKSHHRPRNDPKLYGGPYPFIQTGDLSGKSNIVESFSQTYSDIGLAQSKLWPKGTVCIAIVGATIGESAILGFDACFPDSIIGMVADQEKALPEFIQYVLVAHKAEIKAKGVGSARENINLGTFETQPFPVPELSVQNRVVNRMNGLEYQVSCLEELYQSQLSLLGELQTSILHKAFSGQLTGKESVAA